MNPLVRSRMNWSCVLMPVPIKFHRILEVRLCHYHIPYSLYSLCSLLQRDPSQSSPDEARRRTATITFPKSSEPHQRHIGASRLKALQVTHDILFAPTAPHKDRHSSLAVRVRENIAQYGDERRLQRRGFRSKLA